ncbi:MAG: hypothetical protein AAF368_20405, partial [Planctomycetota bacterium]
MKDFPMDEMNPQVREAWLERLVDFEFDCDENPEELERALEQSAALRELQLEARATAGVLRGAAYDKSAQFDEGDSAGPFAQQSPPAKPSPKLWKRIALAAAGLLAILTGGSLLRWQLYEARWESFVEREFALSVEGPKRTLPGTEVEIALSSWKLASRDMAESEAVWIARDTLGRVVADGQVSLDERQSIALQVPLANLRGVEVAAQREEVKRWTEFTFKNGAPALLHLATDKPLHQPGDPIRALLVPLDPVNHLAADPQLQLRLVDPSGTVANTSYPGFEDGAAAAQWTLPEDAKGGT